MTKNRKRKKRTRKPIARRKWRIIKRTAIVLVVLAGVGAIGILFYLDVTRYLDTSDRYRVKQIEVAGTDRLSTETVIELSGIRLGDPIFSVRYKEGASRVAEHPRILDATAQVTIPDSVAIHVVERVPVALVVFDKGYELDEEGVILGKYEKGLSPQGPIISGVTKPTVVVNGFQLQNDGLKQAIALWKLFSQDPLSKELIVDEIDISAADTLLMILSNKRYEIRWPREGLAHCLWRLKKVWNETGGLPKVRRYVDLRFEEDIPTL